MDVVVAVVVVVVVVADADADEAYRRPSRLMSTVSIQKKLPGAVVRRARRGLA